MKISRKLETPTDVVEDIFCNKCGLSCKSPAGDYYGLLEAEVVAGFYSTHLVDADVHKFSLCERCLQEMFLTFKYPSFQGNYFEPNGDHAEGFNPRKYLGEGVLVAGDPGFAEVMESFRNSPREPYLPEDIATEELLLSSEDLKNIFNEDDEEEEYVSLLSPKIKKEDLN